MTKAPHRWLGLSCAVACALLGGCALVGGGEAREKETRVLTVDHKTGAGLVVHAANGSVTVRRDDRADVQITAELRALTRKRLDETRIIVSRDDEGSLRLRADWPGGRPKNNEACSFELLMPDAGPIDLTSSNGSLVVHGLGDHATLTTSNGSIEVVGLAGPVEASTSNGSIRLHDVLGPIDARGSNGSIETVGAGHTVTAATSNGRIHALGVRHPFNLTTSNGEVMVEVHPAFEGHVELRSNLGSMDTAGLDQVRSISQGEYSMRLSIGSDDTRSFAHTTNSRVRLMTAAE